MMKKLFAIALFMTVLSGCSPEVGSDGWCSNMKEKDKGDWTATETKDFARHCIFK